jgi:lysophospholipase L1-like esterase
MAYNTRNVYIQDFRGYKQTVDPGTGIGKVSPFPTYHVLTEGDSWFATVGDTGFGKPRNLLDTISFNKIPTAIANLAMSGDTITNITNALLDGTLEDALNYRTWNMILLSAGGNDLIDALTEKEKYMVNGRVLSILQTQKKPTSFKSFINEPDLGFLKDHIVSCYMKFNEFKQKSRNIHTPVLLHTYDYPTPNKAPAECLGFNAGPWLFTALNAKYIDQKYWYEISDFLFYELSQLLESLISINGFHVVNTCNIINRAEKDQESSSKDWLNEIHPNAKGLIKLGKKISLEISNII